MENKSMDSQTVRVLPDLQICRAAKLVDQFATCLVENPVECPHTLPFGNGFLCYHSDRSSIIANTKRECGKNQLG